MTIRGTSARSLPGAEQDAQSAARSNAKARIATLEPGLMVLIPPYSSMHAERCPEPRSLKGGRAKEQAGMA